MPFGDNAAENFVLGQRSGFGKAADKQYKKSSQKQRQYDLVQSLLAQGNEDNNRIKEMDDRFEKSINSPAYASAQNLNNFAGSGRKVKYNLAGRGRVMADPNPNNPFRDIYEFARANPQAFETMLQGTVAQSPTKILGYGAEKLTGDSTTGNRISEAVLDELTQKQSGKPGGKFGFRPEMTDEEKRVAGNAFYAQQLKDNDDRDMAKGILQEGGFTTDATYGDVIDTASWFSPGSAVKGIGVGVKASRLALAAAKTSGFAGDVSRGTKMGLGMVGGLGTGGVGGVPLGLAKNVNKTRAANSVTEGVQSKVKAVYDEVMSFPKNIPGHEDLAGKSFEDVMNIANNTQDTELINLTNTLYREQNAMAPLTVLDAAQSVSTGAPATLGKALTQKNLGWMAKHIDPTDVSTHTLSYFTKTKDELKQHMFGTLRGGAARAGLGSEALEFKRWQDIPDDALEKALSGWDGNFHGVVDSNGNKVPSLSLAWDHIDSLYNGGENTTRNLQAMVQYINASLGAKA